MSGIDNAIEYSDDFQKLIITAAFSEPEIFVRCQNILKPDYFSPKFQKAVKYTLDYSMQYNTLPDFTDLQVKSGVSLFKDVEKITRERQQAYLEDIEAFCRHKALELAMFEGMGYLEKKQYGMVEELVKEAMLVSLQTDLGLVYNENPEQRNAELFSEQGSISTGYKELDLMLGGGFGYGELEIFVAPSGGGKSVALQNIALNFAERGMNGVYITLELKENLVASRIDSMLIGKNKTAIRGNLTGTSAEVRLKSRSHGELRIKRMPETTTTVNDIKAYLRELNIQTGMKIDFICVDYLDLLSSPRCTNLSDTFTKDKCVSEELRAMADAENIVCVSASQLNRTGAGKDVNEYDHTNIAGGISKVYTADNVIGIHNTSALRERGEIHFQMLKTRNSGGVGHRIKLKYNIDTLRISDMDIVVGNTTLSQPVNTQPYMSPMSQPSPAVAQHPAPAPSKRSEAMSFLTDIHSRRG